MRDLHELPKVKDSLSYLYLEHGRIKQDGHAIKLIDENGETPIPCAAIKLLMLGPGTSITHAAIKNLAESDCMILWCGEEGVRLYAQGLGGTRNAKNIVLQAFLSSIPLFRLYVAKKMYIKRFNEQIPFNTSIKQLRGREGARVRKTYYDYSTRTGVPWNGRSYKRDSWDTSDSINRAISSANSCLYGICHAAIVAMGYSPALGFIHTGKQLSFVYDIADLYKTDITIPIAFNTIKESTKEISTRIRKECREFFRKKKLLERIVEDIKSVLDIEQYLDDSQKKLLEQVKLEVKDFDTDYALPGNLWDPKDGFQEGGKNYTELIK